MRALSLSHTSQFSALTSLLCFCCAFVLLGAADLSIPICSTRDPQSSIMASRTRRLLVSVLLALLVLAPPSAVDARPVPTPCWLLPMPYTCEPSEFPVPQQATPTVSTDIDQGTVTFIGDADQGTASFIGDADQGTATEASAAQLPDGVSGP